MALLARLAGLEPATLGLEGRCSIRLSYKRLLVGVEGFEPPTFCSQSRRATRLRYTPGEPSNFLHARDHQAVREYRLSASASTLGI